MAEGSAPAAQVLGDLQALQPHPGQAVPASLALRVWVDPDGVVTRVAAGSGGPVLAADLSALFQGRRPVRAPPAGLLLPIRLALKLAPAVAGLIQSDAGANA